MEIRGYQGEILMKKRKNSHGKNMLKSCQSSGICGILKIENGK